MSFRRILCAETGSALIEFLVLGLVFQIGALTLFLQLSNLQASQIAAESIARHSIRSFLLADTDLNETAMQIASDFRIRAEPKVNLTCIPNCLDEGSLLKVEVNVNGAKASAVFLK